jgi:hypothetical protein
MERQLLAPVPAAGVVDVVSRLGGVQAQVPSSANLAVRLRSTCIGPEDVAQALADGRLIRTWAMRGTLHLLTARDAGTFLSLLAAGRPWETPAWEKWIGYTPAVVDEVRAVVREALDGGALTRDELITQLTARPRLRHLGEPLRESWGTGFKPMAWLGELAFGPSSGNRVTFVRPAASPHWGGMPDPEEAAPAALGAYLAAYGPAPLDRYRRWMGTGRIPQRMIVDWFKRSRDRLATVEVDGEEAFIRAEDLDPLMATPPTDGVRLLGGFDQWVLGPGTDDPHIIPQARRREVSRQSGWISPVVLAGGVVRGTWQLDRDTVRMVWFREAGHAPRGMLEEEVSRLSSILGHALSAEIAVS